MSVQLVGAYTLGEVNVAANAAVGLMVPLLTEFDLMLMGSFGLGALQADISAQLYGAMSTELGLAAQVTNPLTALQEALESAMAIQASIVATIALGLPVIEAEVTVEVSASAAISVGLAAKLGGIQALISGALAVKLPAANFLGGIMGHLNAGPVVVLSFSDPADSLGSVGSALGAMFTSGVAGITPFDRVYGVVLVTKAPSAWGAMQATLITS